MPSAPLPPEPEEEPPPKPSWEQREQRARGKARLAEKRLAGEEPREDLEDVPTLPGLPWENRYYVPLQGKPGCDCAGITDRLGELNKHIATTNPRHYQSPQFRSEVYERFASKREATVFWKERNGEQEPADLSLGPCTCDEPADPHP